MNAQELQEVKDFGENPGNLKMFIHVPPNLKPEMPVPLVVVLHGCTQSAGVIAAQTGWDKLADEYGFVVVYPQQRMLNNPEMCFCWYRRRDITKGKGEDLSIIEMTDYAKKKCRVDSSKVFITGLSAGAMMSVVLMSTYPETFNSGAVFAGGPYKCAPDIFTACLVSPGWIHKSPAKWGQKVRKQNPGYAGAYPRMIVYQGWKDPVVNRRNGFEIVKQWTNLHLTDTIPETRIYRYVGNRDIEKDIYKDGNNEDVVIYYKVKKLGHAYLINPGSCMDEGGKRGIFSKDKNYHATWWTALDFGLVSGWEIEGKQLVKSGEGKLVYTVPDHPNSVYTWTYPPGCTLLEGGGTHSITLLWGAASGNLDVTETNASGCHFSYPTIFVKTAP